MALNTLLRRHAAYRPDHTAVVFEGRRLTYRELAGRVDRLIRGLMGLGLRKGSPIAMVLDNSLEVLEIYWVVAQTGMVGVPLSPLLRGDGLVNLITDSGAELVITQERLAAEFEAISGRLPLDAERYVLVDGDAPGFRPYASLMADDPGRGPAVERAGDDDVSDDDVFNIVYSSGTTGLPKGIVHTHRIREAYGTGFAGSFRIHPESVVLHSGSLVFNGAFLTLMPAFYTGCTYVLLPSFDVDRVIDAAVAERVTHMVMVPSQIIALLGDDRFHEGHLPSLEMVLTVGAPLHLSHKEELRRRLPNRFYELYGLTEGFVTVLDRDDAARKTGSVGVPPPLYEMRIVDDDGVDLPAGEVGEIIGRGPITMPGYHNLPDLTAEAIRDGWLFSGDLGYVDDDGFLYLVDRKKDLIISGGVNVYPRDIEEVVVRHPDVVEASVFGVEDERWGESPVAAVTLRPGSAVAPDDLASWVNERVQARYQRIRGVVVVEEFPRSVAGKTLRRVLRDEYSSGEDGS